ncbi:MAG: NUDIX hydrolase [Acidimicrobiia bacterium]|nr:NUDIX hydrolase [Acidimicrobiia bacterium]
MRQGQHLKEWRVATGLIAVDDAVLLVANRRRNEQVEWSPPGGVIDPGEPVLDALTREVREETGLLVETWGELVYSVEVVAPDHGFHLDVVCHSASGHEGTISLDDPDGIVIAAEFVAVHLVADWLDGSPPWVVEPLVEHLAGLRPHGHRFRYRLTGGPDGERHVLRLHD